MQKIGKVAMLLISLLLLAGCGQGSANVSGMEQTNKIEETEITGTDDLETKTDEVDITNDGVDLVPEVGEQMTEAVTVEQPPTETVTEAPAKSMPTPQAGIRSMENLLATAKLPVGTTMYVWGGGWNEADTGAGIEAVSIGVSPAWNDFYQQQNSAYDYQQTRYQIHDGLDCSGYIGWMIYNVFENQDGEPGYVMKAAEMARTFADYGWGTYTPAAQVTEWQPGDIMSMKGHVWLSLGMCGDGSVVLMHASPPGVRICGTQLSDGSSSEAVKLAETYMQNNYPDWYQKYSDCAVDFYYLQDSGQLRFNAETLTDSMQIQLMGAEQVLSLLY